jgi:hypothetical protein
MNMFLRGLELGLTPAGAQASDPEGARLHDLSLTTVKHATAISSTLFSGFDRFINRNH